VSHKPLTFTKPKVTPKHCNPKWGGTEL